MPPRSPGSRRYLLIIGLFVLAGLLLFIGWAFRTTFPNFFDREEVDAAEIQALQDVNLSRPTTLSGESSDWPQFRGANRDGWSPGMNFRTNWNESPPQVLWTKPCGGGYSSFAVVGANLYTMDREGESERIRCLDANTGHDI